MKTSRLLACTALVSTMLLRAASADPVPEYAMKAAFLYNFALFTEWPEVKDGDLTLCIFGKDMFGNHLRAIDGKQLNRVRLRVSHRTEANDLKDCDMLYIGEAERPSLPKILAQLAGQSVLTVTDADGMIRDGVMIEMSVENNRLTFEVNTDAAKRAHIIISSKLLRLAKFVY